MRVFAPAVKGLETLPAREKTGVSQARLPLQPAGQQDSEKGVRTFSPNALERNEQSRWSLDGN